MANNTRHFLFDSQSTSAYATVFELTEQVTVVALGLSEGQTVQFNIVLLKGAQRDNCECNNGAVTFANVVASSKLKCCGSTVTLSTDNPFVIIDAPQGTQIQAVYNITDDQPKITGQVWYTYTNTQNVTDRMRGCQCQ